MTSRTKNPPGDDQPLAIHATATTGRDTADFSQFTDGRDFPLCAPAPKDASGHNIYTLNDLKALQDWVLEREFRSVPRVVDVTSWGGTIRRYEVHPDPDRMRRYGITLAQLQNAFGSSNATVSGDYLNQGDVALTVRSVGLIGGGEDPVAKVLGMTDPFKAAGILRNEEDRRTREIRALVITAVNNQPVRVEDVVEGGRLASGERGSQRGVVVRPSDPPGDARPVQGEGRLRVPFCTDHSLSLSQVGTDDPNEVGCIVFCARGRPPSRPLKTSWPRSRNSTIPRQG